MILMTYQSFFFQKLGKISQNLSSAAIVIGALRFKIIRYTFVPAKSDSDV